jgi:hypothetical protein
MLTGMTHGSDELPPQPAKAGTPAEFTAALRTLRTWSGLTYRQLEGKSPDPLPASTIATTLGRATLPRERFVDSFTRACGLGEDDVRQWLDVRRRIALNDPAEPAEPEAEPSPRWRATAVAAAVGVVVGVAGTLGVTALTGGSATQSETRNTLSAMPVTGLKMLTQGNFVRIHPAGSPDLCLTQGNDRTGRYDSFVVAKMSCEKVPLPHVYMKPVADNVVQLQWQHPEFNIGCLTVVLDGAARDLLEPRDKCDDNDPAQRFRVERSGGHFRLHSAIMDSCLGLRAPAAEVGAEVMQGRCTGKEDQEFEIELVNPPA